MSVPEKRSNISVKEYLANEERASVRSEYVDGQIFAMTGGTVRHSIIITNVSSIVRSHLRGSRCHVHAGHFKVRVEATNSFYYPDVMVSCDGVDGKAVFTVSPVLIVEVLSPSTAPIDCREKVLAYKQIESLNEYLIVNQRRKQLQLYRRIKKGNWDILEYGSEAEIVLESIPVGPLKISIDAIYEDVPLPHGAQWQVCEDAEDEEEYPDKNDLDW